MLDIVCCIITTLTNKNETKQFEFCSLLNLVYRSVHVVNGVHGGGVRVGGYGYGWVRVGVGGHGWMGYLCCEKLLEKFRRDLLDARCSWG